MRTMGRVVAQVSWVDGAPGKEQAPTTSRRVDSRRTSANQLIRQLSGISDGSRGRAAVASESGRAAQPVGRGKVMGWLSKVFEFHPAGLNWPRAVAFLDAGLVPLFVFWAIGHEV